MRPYEIDRAKCSLAGEFTLSAWASELGLKPGWWPHYCHVPGFGNFTLAQILRDGAHVYRVPASKFTFTIYND
jgi:hypothetical protein